MPDFSASERASVLWFSLGDMAALDYTAPLLQALDRAGWVRDVTVITSPRALEEMSGFHRQLMNSLEKSRFLPIASSATPATVDFLSAAGWLGKLIAELRVRKGWRCFWSGLRTALSELAWIRELSRQSSPHLLLLDLRLLERPYNLHESDWTWPILQRIGEISKKQKLTCVLLHHSPLETPELPLFRHLASRAFCLGPCEYWHPTPWTFSSIHLDHPIQIFDAGSPNLDSEWIAPFHIPSPVSSTSRKILYLMRSVRWDRTRGSLGSHSGQDFLALTEQILTWPRWSATDTLVIKPRPGQDLSPAAELFDTYFQGRWQVSHGSVYDHLADTDIVVAEFSSAVLPFLKKGIPTFLLSGPESLYAKAKQAYPAMIEGLHWEGASSQTLSASPDPTQAVSLPPTIELSTLPPAYPDQQINTWLNRLNLLRRRSDSCP